jgi:hypothetical protein
MSAADDTAILIEDFPDDDCTNERTGTDWFKAAGPLPTFLGRPAEPARELAAAIQDAAARPSLLEDTDRLVLTKRRELLVSAILFSGICLGSVTVILFGGNPLFWTPIALGSFGVCGSSVLYLRQLRMPDSEAKRSR